MGIIQSSASVTVAQLVLFLILGAFLTAANDGVRSFSTRPELVPLPPNPDRLLDELVRPFDVYAFNIPVSSGNDDGWHSSMSMAKSGVRVARHCSRTKACRWRRRRVYDDNACASSDNDGRGEDVASIVSDIERSHSVGSRSFASNE